jgi:hypothetical protein
MTVTNQALRSYLSGLGTDAIMGLGPGIECCNKFTASHKQGRASIISESVKK